MNLNEFLTTEEKDIINKLEKIEDKEYSQDDINILNKL